MYKIKLRILYSTDKLFAENVRNIVHFGNRREAVGKDEWTTNLQLTLIDVKKLVS